MTTIQYELIVTPRDVLGKKVKALRRQGITPANIYGHRVESRAIQVPTAELLHLLRSIERTSIISLRVYGESEPRPALVHHLQRHPTNDTPLHVDFYQISLTEKIRLEVPIVLVGEAPAVKTYDGIVVQPLESVLLEGLPTAIPGHIEVDISGLAEIDDAIHIRDLQIPADVDLHGGPDTLVVKVEAPTIALEIAEEEAAAAEEEAAEAAAVEEAVEEGEKEREEEEGS